MDVTIRIHYEKEVKLTVPEGMKLEEFVDQAAKHHKDNLDTKDLEWLGTYVSDELGNEIVTIS